MIFSKFIQLYLNKSRVIQVSNRPSLYFKDYESRGIPLSVKQRGQTFSFLEVYLSVTGQIIYSIFDYSRPFAFGFTFELELCSKK